MKGAFTAAFQGIFNALPYQSARDVRGGLQPPSRKE
jgi:hypothetical protein